jgi:antibiotic biosynthesis monooxygenase
VITRLWRGWTATENADAYEQFLLSELFPSMRRIPGFRGADVLRRPDSDGVAFVTLTRFDSLEDIREFAGEDYDVPVLEPKALALLSQYDERALHFDTASFTT